MPSARCIVYAKLFLIAPFSYYCWCGLISLLHYNGAKYYRFTSRLNRNSLRLWPGSRNHLIAGDYYFDVDINIIRSGLRHWSIFRCYQSQINCSAIHGTSPLFQDDASAATIAKIMLKSGEPITWVTRHYGVLNIKHHRIFHNISYLMASLVVKLALY